MALLEHRVVVGRRMDRLLVLAFALVIAGCTPAATSSPPAGSGDPAATDGGSAPTQPSSVDTSVLVAATNGLGPMIWSPPDACSDNEKIMILIGDSLVRLNKETRQLEPSLAESYELSPDQLTWTFKLRPDVAFHDGYGTMTSEDVKFSYGQWIAENSCHNAKTQMLRAVGGSIDNFEIVDDLTFRLHATEPVVGLPAVLCSCDTGLQILSKRYYEEKGDEALRHPISNGPWKFVSSTPGVEIVLDAVKDHWNESPAFDRLILKEIPDGAARLVQVQSGEVDIALLDSDLLGEAEAAGLTTRSIPDVGNAFVVFGGNYAADPATDATAPWIQSAAPEKGLAVREAMSLAIDRAIILETLLGGQGMLAHGVINQYPANPQLVDPSWTIPEYNIELAKQKLSEGGYPNGFPVTVLLYQQDIDTVAVGEAIGGMWTELGLQVELKPVEEDYVDEMIINKTSAGNAYVNIQSWKPSIAQGLANYISTRTDDSHFFHPAIDEGYLRAEVEADEAETFAIGREVITALRDDMAAIPLFTTDMVFMSGPRVGSWEPVPGLNTFNSMETIRPPG